jgi:hypothetical protein
MKKKLKVFKGGIKIVGKKFTIKIEKVKDVWVEDTELEILQYHKVSIFSNKGPYLHDGCEDILSSSDIFTSTIKSFLYCPNKYSFKLEIKEEGETCFTCFFVRAQDCNRVIVCRYLSFIRVIDTESFPLDWFKKLFS